MAARRPGFNAALYDQSGGATLPSILTAYTFDAAAANLCQDTAGSSAITTTGQSVARWNDTSGSGRNMLQATALQRPIYNLNSGVEWAEGDGADDTLLLSGFTMTSGWSRASAVRILTGVDVNDRIWGPGGSGTGTTGLLVVTSNSPLQVSLYNGSVACTTTNLSLDTDYIFIEFHSGASSTLKVYTKAGTVGTFTGDTGTANVDGVAVFGDGNGNPSPGKARLYAGGAKQGAFTTQNEIDLLSLLRAKLP